MPTKRVHRGIDRLDYALYEAKSNDHLYEASRRNVSRTASKGQEIWTLSRSDAEPY
jgi:hypothetical protein